MTEPDRPDPLPGQGDPPPARRFRLPPRTALAWGGFAIVLVLVVAYLVVPTLRYGARLSPPGPAAWDQPQPATKPAVAPKPKAEAPPPPAASDDNATEATANEEAGNDEAATETAAGNASADEADMLDAIDHARGKALDSGKPKHWDGGGREGYVVPSEPISDGTRECRNLIVSVITADAQPRSSNERYCRDDADADWRPQP